MLRFPRFYLAPPNDSPYGAAPAPQPPSPPPPDPGPGRAVEPPAPPAPGNGPSPPAPSFRAELDAALGPLQSELAQLRQENAALREGLEGRPGAPAPQGDDDFTQSFISDPKGAVTGVVKDVVGSLAPYLRELSGTAQDAIVEGHRVQVDAEFGAGAFEEEIAPVLMKRFEQASKDNPALLANREWIAHEIQSIKGFKMNQLFDRRGKAAEARTEAEKAEAQRLLSHLGAGATNLTGGFRAGLEGKPREPTPAEAEYLELRARAGTPRTLEQLRKAMGAGNTLPEMQEAFQKPKTPKEGE